MPDTPDFRFILTVCIYMKVCNAFIIYSDWNTCVHSIVESKVNSNKGKTM